MAAFRFAVHRARLPLAAQSYRRALTASAPKQSCMHMQTPRGVRGVASYSSASACVPRVVQQKTHVGIGTNHTRQQHQLAQESFPAAENAESVDLSKLAVDQYIQLRDSCTCPLCVDQSTQQKLFQTCDIPTNVRIREWSSSPNGVSITWQNDIPSYDSTHTTNFSLPALQAHLWPSENAALTPLTSSPKTLWDRATITRENLWLDYAAYEQDDAALYKTLKHLNQYGIVFLTNAPTNAEQLSKIAGRIGKEKLTFYGNYWDVKSVPNAKNIAYTQQFLGLHMDLLYTTNPPHLQFLHSLLARAPGGSSLFSDSFHAAHQLWQHHRAHFDALCNFRVPYHYLNDSQHYFFERPVIELMGPGSSSVVARAEGGNQMPQIRRVNWSPPFQGPLRMSSSLAAGTRQVQSPTLAQFVEAAKAFEVLLSGPDALFEYRLEEGDCVVFDNRRVLHARREFDASQGERWLRGCYVDDDVFASRLRVLGERFRKV